MTIYNLLVKKRDRLRNYILNPAHRQIQRVKKYLTPEERNYWWRFNHGIISVKKTEAEYKHDKKGNLTIPSCPTCDHAEETLPHYTYD